jgi:hypothetical protein
METCKTCKWWGAKPEIGPDLRHCDHPKVANKDDQTPSSATDCEGYGGIFTGPDFGCVHHSP